MNDFRITVTLLGATPINPWEATSFKAFVRRSCSNAYVFKRKPKDLKYFSKNYKTLYRIISAIIDPEDLIADKPFNSVASNRFYRCIS